MKTDSYAGVSRPPAEKTGQSRSPPSPLARADVPGQGREPSVPAPATPEPPEPPASWATIAKKAATAPGRAATCPVPAAPTATPAAKKPPSVFADSSRYLQRAPAGSRKAEWRTASRAVHEQKHGAATIGIAVSLCRAPIDANHPGFVDRVSGDIYRFDVAGHHVAVMTEHFEIKTCFKMLPSAFRRAALINSRNISSMSYEELGQNMSNRSPNALSPSGHPLTLRDDILDAARRAGHKP